MNEFTLRPYSEEEAEKVVSDAFDDTRVQVYCSLHNYYGPCKSGSGVALVGSAPHHGCPKCWFVFFLHDIANTPPHERQARLDELEEVVHKLVESAERGEWDFRPYDHPEIHIEKDAA